MGDGTISPGAGTAESFVTETGSDPDGVIDLLGGLLGGGSSLPKTTTMGDDGELMY